MVGVWYAVVIREGVIIGMVGGGGSQGRRLRVVGEMVCMVVE